jgi:hypothetical protein
MIGLQSIAQQRDTTSNGEELLLASELFKKSDEERRLMLLKPRFRYINKDDKRSLIKLGYRPDLGFNYRPAFGNISARTHAIMVAYEKLIGDTPFSWNIETLTRLNSRPLGAYVYNFRTELQYSGNVGDRWLTNGEFFNHRFRVHASLRYYFNMKKRLAAEVSGYNMASEYVFFKIRDFLAYTEVDELNFMAHDLLSSHVFRKKWLVRPAYFSLGLGIQRPFLGKGLIDLNAEVGRRIPFSSGYDYFYKDFAIDLTLLIGLGL